MLLSLEDSFWLLYPPHVSMSLFCLTADTHVCSWEGPVRCWPAEICLWASAQPHPPDPARTPPAWSRLRSGSPSSPSLASSPVWTFYKIFYLYIFKILVGKSEVLKHITFLDVWTYVLLNLSGNFLWVFSSNRWESKLMNSVLKTHSSRLSYSCSCNIRKSSCRELKQGKALWNGVFRRFKLWLVIKWPR